MSRYIQIPAVAAGTWQQGVPDEASLPATGNALYDTRIALAEESVSFWNGTAWVPISGGGGGGGVTTMAAFGSSPNNNAGSISGVNLTLQPADATHPGGVSTGTQSFGGAKTFVLAPAITALTASQPVVTDGSKVLSSVSYATFLSSLGAAPTASPTFTGTVTLPSGSVTSSAWSTGSSTLTVNGVAFSAKAPLASPTFTGTVTLPSGSVTSSAWDTGTSTLTVNGVAFSAKAPTASPTFTGTVTLPSGSVTSSAWDTGTSTFTSNGVAFTAKAPLASPTFSGTVTMPDSSTWTSSLLQLPNAKKIAFGGLSTVSIDCDSAFQANLLRLAVPTNGSLYFAVNASEKLYIEATLMNIGVSSNVRLTAASALKMFYGGGAPTPPAEIYLKDIYVDTGSNTTIGTATLVGGTVTVSTNKVLTGDLIFLTRNTPGGTLGNLSAKTSDITNATSFIINSDNASDTSTVNWWVIHNF